ncbi:Hint domain-containing protein [Pseudoalteromonas luteoviolacea]|uniref:Hint domain-containing protein n=1 Tax=Pseudoalteromonas luteoviolacea H33 TaxID=1365251 RepID=A0A167EQQ3_9GAMM|nr:Hint domain-containing protein [Pseudoalteromonas luteoviolacea]KZN51085.1 hypothetical protein N476_14415 [Pseudoalteromonas luteoviolacea H33]KZN72122.1 hypothetical protein N477_03010 [Pseudoalteromonas luteoviolacea H33-S]
MKLVSLAVIAALGGASLCATAAPVLFENPTIQTIVQPDASLSEFEQVKLRLGQHGLNEKNRPHLFKVLRNTERKKMQEKEQGLATTSLAESSNAMCTTSDQVCSFFKDLGFKIATGTDQQEYIFVSAINSEASSTVYTYMDLTLVNENNQPITVPRVLEYFGEGSSTQKRMDISSVGKVNEVLPKLMAAERIYANTWVVVVYIDATGAEVTEAKQMRIEYPKETILAELGYVRSYATARDLPMQAAMHDPNNEMSILPSSSYYDRIDRYALIQYDIINPKDKKEIKDDKTLNRIKVCLNRRYDDCDIDAYYDPGTPNEQVKVVVPFTGYRDILGKVTKIYRPDWSTKNVTYDDKGNPNYIINPKGEQPFGLYHGSEIFIQTKELGGASVLGAGYQGSNYLFSDYISLKLFRKPIGKPKEGQPQKYIDVTRLSWNIPRSKGIFGDARLYGRYEDAHWIMNLAFEVEQQFGPTKQIRHFAYVIGSQDMPKQQTFVDIDHPPLQMVFSCLAKGSKIKLANGKELAIEQLNVGDTVLGASQFAPNVHMPLEIKDISIGSETQPMVKLTTESGKELLLTESHPVLTQAGVSAWANKVQVGDRIRTSNGLELVSKVEEVKYDDHVYNLKLARTADDPNHSPGETFSMFANGLQVGDLAMQTDNEFEEVVETEQDVLKRIPEAWHKDYLNSLNK